MEMGYTFIYFVYMSCLTVVVTTTSTVQVKTKLGIIRGLNITLNHRHVIHFRQVPYAKPPTNDLRFKKPELVLPWAEVLDGTKFGPVCPQIMSDEYRKVLENTDVSEDCLHLYIYIPNGMDKKNLKTVMIYIHGGGYHSKSGTMYNGSRLALHGDVIVILINYRLGMFGFMSTEDNNAKGNYGLWDQIQALKWIKEHIYDFGGDSSKITVFGHSSGGFSVGLLSLSPITGGLYQRGISLSGFATSERAITHGAKNRTLRLAKILSCDNKSMDSKIFDTSVIVECIRTKSMSAILNATRTVQTEDARALSFIMSPAAPVIDKEILMDKPKRLFSDRVSASFKRFISMDYMAGTNDAEGELLRYRISSDVRFSNYTHAGITSNAFCGIVIPRISDDYFKANEIVSKAICEQYKSETNDLDQGQRSVEMYGDMMYTSEAVRTLRSHSKYSNRTTYQFVFTHESPFTSSPKWMKGAYHGFEVPFIFRSPVYNYSNEESSLNDVMMTYLTNFAKYGNPNGIQRNNETSQEKPFWKKFDVKDESYINLNINMTVGEHLNEDRMTFWLDTVPGILSGKHNVTGRVASNSIVTEPFSLSSILILYCLFSLIANI